MAQQPSTISIGSSVSIPLRREDACEAFEKELKAWQAEQAQAGAGQAVAVECPKAEKHLGGVKEQHRWFFLKGLLPLEIDYRSKAGQKVDLKEFGERFSDLGSQVLEFLGPMIRRERLGNYELLELVGSGGMGEVYRARHDMLNEVRALKVLYPRNFRFPKDMEERLRVEAETGAKLIHENIVRTLDAGQIDGKYFIATEFVQGSDLDTLVTEEGPLTVGQACEVLRQAALGLQHAHENFVTHRDIKPSNLMLTRAGGQVRVKLLDLGLARLELEGRRRITGENETLGTPDFMAPEQFLSSRVDTQADIYSLGCTLFFLITGKSPYSSEGSGAGRSYKLAEAHRKAPVPCIYLNVADARPLQPIVEKMMAKQPADRYQTPADVATALAPFADASPLRPLVGLTTAVDLPVASRETPSGGGSSIAVPRLPPIWERIGRRTFLAAVGTTTVAAAGLSWWLWPTAGPVDAARTVLFTLPGLSAADWFEEAPWLSPPVRAQLAANLNLKRAQELLATTATAHANPLSLYDFLRRWLDAHAAEKPLATQHLFTFEERRLDRENSIKDLNDAASVCARALDVPLDESAEQPLLSEPKALESVSRSPEILHLLGVLWSKISESSDLRSSGSDRKRCRDGAEEAFKRALALYPANGGDPAVGLKALCHFDYGYALDRLGKGPDALDQFEKAIALADRVGSAMLGLAARCLLAAVQGHVSGGQSRADGTFVEIGRLLSPEDLAAGGGSLPTSDNGPTHLAIPPESQLRAHYHERYAWHLLNHYRPEGAIEQFRKSQEIRSAARAQYPRALIQVFHATHGKALAARYLGIVEDPEIPVPVRRRRLDRLLAKGLDYEKRQLEADLTGCISLYRWVARHAAARNLAGQDSGLRRELLLRSVNAGERAADCSLFSARPTAGDDLGKLHGEYAEVLKRIDENALQARTGFEMMGRLHYKRALASLFVKDPAAARKAAETARADLWRWRRNIGQQVRDQFQAAHQLVSACLLEAGILGSPGLGEPADLASGAEGKAQPAADLSLHEALREAGKWTETMPTDDVGRDTIDIVFFCIRRALTDLPPNADPGRLVELAALLRKAAQKVVPISANAAEETDVAAGESEAGALPMLRPTFDRMVSTLLERARTVSDSTLLREAFQCAVLAKTGFQDEIGPFDQGTYLAYFVAARDELTVLGHLPGDQYVSEVFPNLPVVQFMDNRGTIDGPRRTGIEQFVGKGKIQWTDRVYGLRYPCPFGAPHQCLDQPGGDTEGLL